VIYFYKVMYKMGGRIIVEPMGLPLDLIVKEYDPFKVTDFEGKIVYTRKKPPVTAASSAIVVD